MQTQSDASGFHSQIANRKSQIENPLPHLLLIPFLFALGACVGSFLNVVVWRLPRVEYQENDSWLKMLSRAVEKLSNPPSHCPKCQQPIRWYDNIPVIGWLKLGGKCRNCRAPISPRYPIVEAIAGLLFVFYYVMFFMAQIGPCADPHRPLDFRLDWPIYLLYMAMIAALLAASLIDAELFIIPIEIPWVMAALGLVVHAIIDRPSLPGALNAAPGHAALAAGGAVGLVISLILLVRGKLPVSFSEGEPMQDVAPQPSNEPAPPAMTRGQIYREIFKEVLFLTPPLLLAIAWWSATTFSAPLHNWWTSITSYHWVGGLLGSILGALVGGLVVWITRILGTLGFGRLAMGLGDVHLMFGVGAIVGAASATIAFFIAPFFGIAVALYMLVTGTRRELPYGPYLSMATGFVVLFSCPIIAWLTPGAEGLGLLLREVMGG